MTYEVVLDNSRMLSNCFEEAPLEAFVVDLPAWHANLTGVGDYSEVSTPDTSSFLTVTPLNRVGAGYFAESDEGAIVSGEWIYMPITLDGYVLTKAHYVVIAKRGANDGAAASGYTGYNPTPTTVPFLHCESPSVTDGTSLSDFVFNAIPVGSFGEVECPTDELLSRLTGAPGTQKPANRLWNEDFIPGTGQGTTAIDVAYYAVRLYYDPV